MKKLLTVLFVLTISLAFAEKVDLCDGHKPNPLTNYEGMPSGVVAGCVNMMGGDYFESSIDLILPLPEPLSIQRSYTSSNTYDMTFEKGSLCYGWNLNNTGLLEICCEVDNLKK